MVITMNDNNLTDHPLRFEERRCILKFIRRKAAEVRGIIVGNPTILVCTILLGLFLAVALLSPLLLGDPRTLDTANRLKPPGSGNWFGTDQLGRSVLVRTLYGTRISLAAGFAVATVTTVFGLFIGLVSGFLRRLDSFLMRIMDGIMAIPGVLLAIALMSLFGSSLQNVIIAISIPEIPRMARMVRSATLAIREQTYVEAAISNGTRLPRLLIWHVLPNAVAPILVQGTYVLASAMIVEAILSFLGAGTPPEIPSWGNMLAEGRQFIQRAPWIMAFPGFMLAVLVLTVNVIGDALRDSLDPRLKRRLGP
jgi:peptide/nickel transport system permease protein